MSFSILKEKENQTDQNPITMNSNLQINPTTLKAALVFISCTFLIMHYLAN